MERCWAGAPPAHHPYLDKNLPLELVGGREPVGYDVHGLGEECVPEHLLEILGHVPLLSNAAVVLNGQDDRVPAGEGAVC